MIEPAPDPERQRAAAERWAEICARPTALYRLYDASDTLLYVGITCDLKERWKDHAQDKRKPWWPQVFTKTFEWHENRSQAERAERRAIATEKPRYNVALAYLQQGVGYRLGWLRGMLSDEEEKIRTPRYTPRSKRGKQALADVLRRRAALDDHTPTSCWQWDGERLTPLLRGGCAPSDPAEFREWVDQRRKLTVLDTAAWTGCKPWPEQCVQQETRRMRGECPVCVGQPFPCAVVRELAEPYKGHPEYCL